jgi:tetratricopeptide (TPR) repeat protein
MFSLFGSKKSAEDIIPELKRQVVDLQQTTGISYLPIASSLLQFGVSFLVRGNGLLRANTLSRLANAIESLGSLIQNEQSSLGSLGSAIIDIKVPEFPPEHWDVAVNQIKRIAMYYGNQGCSFEVIGTAMMRVSREVATIIDKDGFLALAIFRQEYRRRYDEYRRERLRHTSIGKRCTDESINLLLQAEVDGFTPTIERDGTFVLSSERVGNYHLRSNVEIEQFGRQLKMQKHSDEANRTPVERLVEQGDKEVQEQRLENAIGSYSAALRIKPDSAEIYFQRGIAWSNTYYNRGRNSPDLQKAIDDYTRSIEIDPEYGEAYFQRAGLFSEQGQVGKAIEDYSKAIANGHQVSHSHYCRAHLWKSAGEAGSAKAIADFDEAIRTGDKHNQYISLMARGEIHCDLGNFELAAADLTAAAAYYPNNPPGLYTQRAAALRQLGRTREAIAELDQAIAAVSPLATTAFVADIYDQRGQCRMQLGESNLARQDFERAAQLKR